MTFKGLQKLIESQQEQEQQQQLLSNQSPKLQRLIQRIKGKEFWIWDQGRHRDKAKKQKDNCCFSHIIGLPRKDGHRKLLFYEAHVVRALLEEGYLNSTSFNKIQYPFKEKHVAVLKAVGLGISELCLRLIAWLCLRNNELQGSQMIIFTGPRLELAVSLINRLKSLFLRHGITFVDKETVCNLNNVRIEAFPSHHADSARGLPNVSLIFADECSFFPDHEKDNILDIMLRNVLKSNPYLITVSTPNKPGDLMEQIMKEPFETSPFKRLWLDYSYGVDKIYTKQEIDEVKGTRSFEREFCLKFAGIEGNVFSQAAIDNCQKIDYNPPLQIVPDSHKFVAIDPGFGSSNFAIVATQLVDGKIQVIHAEEYPRTNFTDMVNQIWELKNRLGHVTNIYVDAANPEVIRSLKQEFGESFNEQYMKEKFEFARKYNTRIEDSMFIVPVPFSVEGAKMLQHAKWLVEETDQDGSSLIAIHPSFDKLLTSLRTAVATEYRLDKRVTSFNDILDAFRLALQFYKRTK